MSKSSIGRLAASVVAGLLVLSSFGTATAKVGATCGGIIGRGCGAHEYCRLTPKMCHVSDAQGVCATKPRFCPEIFRPVCGCNGHTYGNACAAAQAGASVLHNGRCGKT
ncbi:MAG TPA: Kazal-type serine protease inhibitor domain-containing protein [Caulobacteraceae bacterium]|jgi:hypothetical protein